LHKWQRCGKNLCHPEGNIQIGALVVVGIETSPDNPPLALLHLLKSCKLYVLAAISIVPDIQAIRFGLLMAV
jgi:hypothetical protein